MESFHFINLAVFLFATQNTLANQFSARLVFAPNGHLAFRTAFKVNHFNKLFLLQWSLLRSA